MEICTFAYGIHMRLHVEARVIYHPHVPCFLANRDHTVTNAELRKGDGLLILLRAENQELVVGGGGA